MLRAEWIDSEGTSSVEPPIRVEEMPETSFAFRLGRLHRGPVDLRRHGVDISVISPATRMVIAPLLFLQRRFVQAFLRAGIR